MSTILMFIENFNKIIISELKYVLSEMPEEERTPENLIEKFSIYIGGSHDKKKKTPVKKGPLEESVRCCALKKDGDQCNGKRLLRDGETTDLCSLHTRNGVKFGYYVANSSSSEAVETEEAEAVEAVEVKKTYKKRPAVSKTAKVAATVEPKTIYDYRNEPGYEETEDIENDSDFE